MGKPTDIQTLSRKVAEAISKGWFKHNPFGLTEREQIRAFVSYYKLDEETFGQVVRLTREYLAYSRYSVDSGYFGNTTRGGIQVRRKEIGLR